MKCRFGCIQAGLGQARLAESSPKFVASPNNLLYCLPMSRDLHSSEVGLSRSKRGEHPEHPHGPTYRRRTMPNAPLGKQPAAAAARVLLGRVFRSLRPDRKESPRISRY